MPTNDTIPLGLCQCGCGQETRPAPYTSATCGWTKGQPLRYVRNHHQRTTKRLSFPFDRVSVEDRGYKTPCWVWVGRIAGGGYGRVRFQSRVWGTHVLAYTMFREPVPEGLELDHLCRVRGCCNPDHLEAVTAIVNRRRGNLTKINEDTARQIKAVKGLEPLAVTAERHNVSRALISHIQLGKSWADA